MPRASIEAINISENARRIVSNIEGATQRDLNNLTLLFWRFLTERTPRDTGRARAGWIATSNAPSNFISEEGLTQYTIQVPVLDNQSYINWVTNNLPYIVPLNEGSSVQAPAMFVEIALRQAVNQVFRR